MPTTAIESPLPLSEILKLHPGVPAHVIYHLTRKCCTPHGEAPAGAGRRRAGAYLPSEVAKAVGRWRRRNTQRRPADCLKFKERGVWWVAEEKLPEGIDRATADRMFRDGKIRKPRMVPIDPGKQGGPWYRKFWPRNDVKRVLSAYGVPLADRDAARSVDELKPLGDDEYVAFTEAKALGFSKHYLREHSDLKDPRLKHPPTPAPPIGRLIRGQWCERISTRDHRVKAPTWHLGDLRECIKNRDNPPGLPVGAVLVRDAIPKMREAGIKVSVSNLKALIKSETIRGGKVDGFKRNFAPERMCYMLWEDRTKIPQHERPGGRVYWIEGRDYHPIYEAVRLAGCDDYYLTRDWTPAKHGGFGRACPHLGRTVRCRIHNVPHKLGNSLLVYDGDDLRTIAEALTGTRPKAPPKPPAVTPPPAANGPAPAAEPPKPAKGKRGRPRKDTEHQEHRQLWGDWLRFRGATKAQKADFAASRGADTPKEVAAFLDRLEHARACRCNRGRGL